MSKYTAIIVEPRKHRALEFVINNICDCLSDEWSIILFHGLSNIEYIMRFIINLNIKYNNRISLVSLDVDNLDQIEYSKLFTTKSIIYDNIKTDIFLVFQTDSMIFKQNANLINEYLEYDYVGSPWLITNYYPTYQCNFIGNGGFSLRNKNKMLEIIDKNDWNSKTELIDKLEDLFFSKSYENITVKKPDYNKACQFCVDEVISEITLACHRVWCHQHYNIFKLIYPEVEILYNLQYIEK